MKPMAILTTAHNVKPYHFCISCGTGIQKEQAIYSVKRRGRILCPICLEALGVPPVDCSQVKKNS